MKLKKKNKFKINKIMLIILGIFVIILLVFAIASDYYLSSVDKKSDEIVKFEINNGTGKNSIADDLEEAGLIRSATVFKIYIKLNIGKELYAGTYNLSRNMTVKEIIDVLSDSKGAVENEVITVQFLEGKRLTDYAEIIENKFGYKANDVMDFIDSDEFVDKMIKKYDFITEEVKQEEIYHPLEGYLFPDTYNFRKNASIEEIITKMILTMEKKLKNYEDDINISKYSVHELLTLASIIELEAGGSSKVGNDVLGIDDDKVINAIAEVFYNRVDAGLTLGSDVTTYYAVKKDFSRDLSKSDLKSCNKYNTRSENTCSFTGLPIGPIASPSLKSIGAVMEPIEHNYYYFVADKYKKTYFAETYKEHTQIVSKLRKEGLWYEY